MTKDNTVIFKGGKSGIIIFLNDDASFKDICIALRRKIREASKFFEGAATSIAFKGKQLEELQILELLEIINSETDLSITFVEDLTGSDSIAVAPAPATNPAEPPTTYFHKGNLRNGQAIIQTGSVVVMGDVNAGAEVAATGNIIVMGIIRGLVAAGTDGDTSAFISAFSIQPHQFLSIAGNKVHFTKEMLAENKNDRGKTDPEYAFIKNGMIHIDSIASMR